jgi:cytoskeletal protein RodZ
MKKVNQQGFAIGTLLLIIVIVGLIGAVGWLVYDRQQKNDEPTSNSSVTKEDTKESTESLAKTSITQGATTVVVEHSSSWKVEDTTTEYGPENPLTLPSKEITSAKGNTLRLYTTPGVGGDCDNDEIPFTLVQKLATETNGVYFSEYTMEDSSYPTTGFKIDNSNIDVSNVEAGYNGTGVCQNRIGNYSSVSKGDNAGSENEVFVKIVGAGKSADDPAQVTTYEEIKDDAEFIAMLKSLEVK